MFFSFAAESASNVLNSGKELVWPGGGPAFLAFVDKLPPNADAKDLFLPPPGLLVSKFTDNSEKKKLEN